MKTLVACAVLLCACDGGTKCIDGRMAYRAGDSWVIPDGAYKCIPIEVQK